MLWLMNVRPGASGSTGQILIFISQSLRAIVRPGAVSIREHRLDDVLHQVEVRGTLSAGTAPELARRIDSALAAGVLGLIADPTEAADVSDGALASLVNTAHELRARRGELGDELVGDGEEPGPEEVDR
jgi:hypothetical protein